MSTKEPDYPRFPSIEEVREGELATRRLMPSFEHASWGIALLAYLRFTGVSEESLEFKLVDALVTIDDEGISPVNRDDEDNPTQVIPIPVTD